MVQIKVCGGTNVQILPAGAEIRMYCTAVRIQISGEVSRPAYVLFIEAWADSDPLSHRINNSPGMDRRGVTCSLKLLVFISCFHPTNIITIGMTLRPSSQTYVTQ